MRLVKFSVMKYSVSLIFPWLFFSYGGMLSAYMRFKFPIVIDVASTASASIYMTTFCGSESDKGNGNFFFFLLFQLFQLFLLFRLIISCSLHNIRETINSLNIKLPCHEWPRQNISLQHQADKWWDWRKMSNEEIISWSDMKFSKVTS